MLPDAVGTPYASLLRVRTEVNRAVAGNNLANILIIGVGGLGLWCVQLARHVLYAGHNVKIFVADVSKERIDLSIELILVCSKCSNPQYIS